MISAAEKRRLIDAYRDAGSGRYALLGAVVGLLVVAIDAVRRLRHVARTSRQDGRQWSASRQNFPEPGSERGG